MSERKPTYEELEARIRALEDQVRRLTELLEKTTRAGKRQAAPFSKGKPKADPKKPGRKSGKDHGTQKPTGASQWYDYRMKNACRVEGVANHRHLWSLRDYADRRATYPRTEVRGYHLSLLRNWRTDAKIDCCWATVPLSRVVK